MIIRRLSCELRTHLGGSQSTLEQVVMDQRIEQILPLVSRPARYVGGEKNALQKRPDQVELRIALAFPDVYEVAMSHLGLEILYGTLNGRENIAAERIFAPWPDAERQIRARGISLVSLESCRPLREFDIVGFSLQYELSYTNILNILDLGRVPLFAIDRGDAFPLIIAGGPGTSNPEPIADFFDLFVIGDGEEAILEICDRIIEAKKEGRSKGSLLDELSHIQGVYVPSLFHVDYHENGRIKGILPLKEDHLPIKRRIVGDLDRVPYPTTPVVPWLKTVHDRLSVEIARGCKRGCRFCQAGYIYRPYRERRPEVVEGIIEKSLNSTGYEELSFLSLSSGDYHSIKKLLGRVMNYCQREQVAVSFPSLRVETLNSEIVRQIKRVRKTGFTLAPEAATERLRRVINKEMDEENLLKTARSIYKNGWNLIKLYFMIGLPTETDEDVREIVRLAQRVLDQGRGCKRPPRLNVSVSTFVPKPHTPFQWESQITLKEIRLRQGLLHKGLRAGRIRLKWHEPRMSLLEGVFSRGDRKLSRVIHEAWKMGCRFDGWSESFQWELWQRAFEKTGIHMESYTRCRSFSEILSWSHIQCGVTEEFLKQERERSRREKVTRPCRKACTTCGVCDGEKTAVASWKMKDPAPIAAKPSGQSRERPFTVILEFQKVGPARFLGHLDMARAFHRAARRAGLPLRYSQGFHPAPKISFEGALALGLESICEEMKWELDTPVTDEWLLESVNAELPEGIRIKRLSHVSGKHRFLHSLGRRDHYLVAFCEGLPKELQNRIHEFLRCDRWVVPSNGKAFEFDMRPYIEKMVLTQPASIHYPVTDIWADLINNGADFVEVVSLIGDGVKIRIDRILSTVLSLSEQMKSQMRILRLNRTQSYGG